MNDSESLALDIVWQDDSLVVINKPAGLLVHRSPIDRHETRFALQLLRDQLGQRVYPVHRLDKPTSGLLLFGLDPGAARLSAQQFERREVAKTYLAVCRGYCPERVEVDHALRDKADPLADRPRPGEVPARKAHTLVRRLATVELPVAVDRYPRSRYSLAELQPLTGRRHQLRRHMKHLGHPLIGDAKYGKGVHNRYFRDQLGCGRLLLACVGLRLRHPLSGQPLALAASPGSDFEALLQRLGWTGAARFDAVTGFS